MTRRSARAEKGSDNVFADIGVDQPKLSALYRGRLREFSLERLMRLLATIEVSFVVRRFVRHVGRPTDAPVPMPTRPPPLAHAPTFEFPG